MTGSARRLAVLMVIGVLLVALTACGLDFLDWQPVGLADDMHLVLFMTSLCLSGVLWLLAVFIVRSGRLPARTIWMVLAIATAMRLLTLTAPPILSSDIYRYVWDGRVQLAGVNPYRFVPAADELAFLRDEAVYPHINRADYAPTVYPPGAQVVFALAAAVTPGLLGMKLMITAFDVLAIAVLIGLLRMAGRDPAELLIYAWLPLSVWEFAGNAHIDGVAAGLLVLGLLLALRGRMAWTGVVLGIAALTKFLPAVVLPALWRPWNRWLPIGFAVTLAALYLPFLLAGSDVFGFLPGYYAEEGLHSGQAFFLLQLLDGVVALPEWTTGIYIALVLVLLLVLGARYAFVEETSRSPGARLLLQARQAIILGTVLLVALSPRYPWYFGWLAPLACLTPLPSVLWLLASAPLLAHGAVEHLAVPGVVFGPAIVLAAFELYRSRSRQPVPLPIMRSAG
jgi:alpha-1,6-mannosyltransferase